MKLDWDYLQYRLKRGDWMMPIAIMVLGICLTFAVLVLSGCTQVQKTCPDGRVPTWNYPCPGTY